MPDALNNLRVEHSTRSLTELKSQAKFLLRQMLAMAREDVALLEAAAGKPNVGMTTAQGSANDRLWSAMERLGWLTSRALKACAEEPSSIPSCLYKFTPQGVESIGKLLIAYAEERPKVDGRMVLIANGLCQSFSAKLVRRVRDGGGSPRDVSALLALVIDSTVARIVKHEDHNRCAEGVLDDMRRIIAGRVATR